MKKNKKWVIIAVIALIIVVSVAAVFLGKGKTDANDSNAVYVETDLVETEDLSSTIDTKGVVVAKESANVYADVSGAIASIEVEEGATVITGQPLIVLNSETIDKSLRDAKLQLTIAELNYENVLNSTGTTSAVRDAKTNYESAKETFEDQTVLYEAGAVSEKEYKASKDAYDMAYNAYKDAQSSSSSAKKSNEVAALELEIAKNNVDDLLESKEKATIKAPISGTLTQLMVSDHDMVSPGVPVAMIESTDDLEVVAYIGEYDINSVAIGQSALITGYSVGDSEYKANVSFIGSKAEVTSTGQSTERSIMVKFDLLEETAFKPNFSADVELTTAESKEAKTVAYDALRFVDGQYSVFTVVEGKAVQHQVTLGVEGDIVVEIIADDINIGDTVILDPPSDLNDGDSIVELGAL